MRDKHIMLAASVTSVLALGIYAPALAQEVSSIAPVTTPTQALQPVLADYQLGPQDVLNIDVFGMPELTQTVQIDSGGYISLPLIGRVTASGRTSHELSDDIARKLDSKYTKGAIVTVMVKDAASKKVTVDGSVVQPGLYEINPQTTLTQAVALAHGPDQVADIHHVGIVRNTTAGRTVTVFDLDEIRAGKVPDPYIQANDEVVVDVSGTRKFVRDFGGVLSILGMFRP